MKRIHNYDSFLENVLLADYLSKQNADLLKNKKKEIIDKQKSQQKLTSSETEDEDEMYETPQGQMDEEPTEGQMEDTDGECDVCD